MAESRWIITASSGDRTYPQLTRDQWWGSFKATQHSGIRAAIMSYGMPAAICDQLRSEGCVVLEQEKRLVTQARWWDLEQAIDTLGADQVMLTDGGDIIFQRDLAPAFDYARETLCAAPEEYPNFGRFLFAPIIWDALDAVERRSLLWDTSFNCGVVCGPSNAMKRMSRFMRERMTPDGPWRTEAIGPDQAFFNVAVRSMGCRVWPKLIHYPVCGSTGQLSISPEGLCVDGELAYIAHNVASAYWDMLRIEGHKVVGVNQDMVRRSRASFRWCDLALELQANLAGERLFQMSAAELPEFIPNTNHEATPAATAARWAHLDSETTTTVLEQRIRQLVTEIYGGLGPKP